MNVQHSTHDWKALSACYGLTSLFFPVAGSTDTALQAKAVCATCPVIEPCLMFAVTNYEKHGIWGGTSEKERRILRKELGLAADRLEDDVA
jgi:WhiB family redox-sensing transcriptional regulator